jgi:Fic family protein
MAPGGSQRYTTSRERWEPSLDALTGIPRRARTPARIVAYVPASLAASSLSLDADTVAAVVDAENAIRRAQQYADTAGVSTIAQQLLRSEAIASSRMEGIDVPSHRSVAKAIAGDQHRPTAQAAIANIDAVKWIYERAADGQPLTMQAIRDIHTRLAQADRHIAAHAGMIRTRQNWIGHDPDTPVGAEFIPPPARDVEPLLDDLCRYANRADMPAVVQAAVVHAQFETIHPFADGNGRVGRALIGATFTRRGLARAVIPPVSLVLARSRDAYVNALTAWRFDDDGPDRWVRLLASACETAALASEQLASAVTALMGRWREQAGYPRAGSSAEAIIRALPAAPIISSKRGQQITGASEAATLRALNHLAAAGVLAQVTVGRRNRQWESVGLFALVDDMERRVSAGQRGAADTR